MHSMRWCASSSLSLCQSAGLESLYCSYQSSVDTKRVVVRRFEAVIWDDTVDDPKI